MQRFIVWGVSAYILGILAIQNNIYLFTVLFLGELWLYSVFISPKGLRQRNLLLFLNVFVLLGLGRTIWINKSLETLPINPGKEVTFQGQVRAEPQYYSGRTVYVVNLLQTNGKLSRKKVLVNVVDTKPSPYEYGDILKITGKVELPKRAKNSGEFDYRWYLKRQGILVQTYLRPSQINLIRQDLGNPLYKLALLVKARTERTVNKYLPQTEANIFNSIFFGDKGLLTDEQKDMFSRLGIMHVFAVSGSNVAVVLLFLQYLSILLRLKPTLDKTLLICGLGFYALLTGLSAVVLRATLMAMGILCAKWFLRQWDFYSGLAGAALLILLINPLTLFDSGFQLSFTVTWGLIYLGALFNGIGKSLPFFQTYLAPVLTAQIATLPLTAYYFNLISLTAVLTNLVVVPAIGILVLLGMGVLILVLIFPPLAVPFIYSSGFILKILVASLMWLGKFPWNALPVKTPSIYLIIGIFLCLIALVEIKKKQEIEQKYPQAIPIVLIIFLLLNVGYFVPNYRQPNLEVTFIDVGQGDAIFIATPKGKKLLLDGGGQNFTGAFNAGEKIVVPYLIRRGIFKLDGIISSHPDTDHISGLFPVLETLKINTLFIPPTASFGQEYKNLIKLAQNEDCRIQELTAGQTIKLDEGKVLLEVLNPPGKKLETTKSTSNNNSLVIRLVYGKATFLLSGDLEEEGMEQIYQQKKLLEAVVFKVPHHGSKYAFHENFLGQIHPQIVVFTVGKNNFGHPAKEIIDYWQQQKVRILRTDWDGAITFRTNGSKIYVQTMGREKVAD
ncbi:DNA internalization-related competence protein ComEC/Rec2 [Bacillota bacterium LX-D]|nr:DNA internalization-related competence protein ComEC/Rec2 [Bacillota bacterium LX-D]